MEEYYICRSSSIKTWLFAFVIFFILNNKSVTSSADDSRPYIMVETIESNIDSLYKVSVAIFNDNKMILKCKLIWINTMS